MNASETQRVLDKLAVEVKDHYGGRLLRVYRVDRNAVLEDEDRSEAEIVVVLADGSWRPFDEARELTRLTFDVLMDSGIYVRAWPVSASEWDNPAGARYPELVSELRKYSGPVRVAA